MKKTSIIEQFSSLTYSQQSELLNELKFTLSSSRPILSHKKLNKECIYCKSVKVYKHGKYKNGGSRFHCQDCKKSYNELTGTGIHCIKKKELWDMFIEKMFDSKSIRRISKELGISTKTVFDWRHKVLGSFDDLFKKEFKGIVELDDVYFPFNQKGRKKNKKKIYGGKQGLSDNQVSVMVTIDRYKTFDFKMVKLGGINTENLERVMDMSKFNKENIICSDKSTTLKCFIKNTGINHIRMKSKSGKGMYHVNTLNNLIGRIDKWVKDKFINVSTKYLKSYLNWFLVMELLDGNTGKFWDYLLLDNKTFNRIKMIENNYQEFLSY